MEEAVVALVREEEVLLVVTDAADLTQLLPLSL